ncbi:hypothetical protein CC78DRAFT_545828 [Lojkania enalia]|uniref:Uncharacterized protein n=1 Tax=Lojkania enalia TaxID=147567 RepID=A0A9P4K6R9_9PLEO|nr:hypothetical protein CC78DRAFT_545828 [Didymosphaeria enalia]
MHVATSYNLDTALDWVLHELETAVGILAKNSFQTKIPESRDGFVGHASMTILSSNYSPSCVGTQWIRILPQNVEEPKYEEVLELFKEENDEEEARIVVNLPIVNRGGYAPDNERRQMSDLELFIGFVKRIEEGNAQDTSDTARELQEGGSPQDVNSATLDTEEEGAAQASKRTSRKTQEGGNAHDTNTTTPGIQEGGVA